MSAFHPHKQVVGISSVGLHVHVPNHMQKELEHSPIGARAQTSRWWVSRWFGLGWFGWSGEIFGNLTQI